MEILQIAVDRLANSMRIYVETKISFESLKLIDKEEAINNLDRAFEAKLEAFHSLYDVSKNYFDYFEHADTALLILLRNAIHHRDHLLFKSWNYEMLLNGGLERNFGAEFLMASHDVVDAVHTMQYYYKVDDILERIDENLNSQFLESRMSSEKKNKLLSQIDTELNFKKLHEYAFSQRYPSTQVYINVIPIFISSVCKVFKALKLQGMEFKGYDSKVYERPFTDELTVDFEKFNYKPIRIA